MIYTNTDITLIISLLTFVFWQMSKTSSREMREVYGYKKNPPSWVFGVVWTILYVLIALSGYFSMCSVILIDQFYLARAILFIVNIFLNKYWSVVFFDMKMHGWPSILTLVLIILTGAAYFTLDFLSYFLTTPLTPDESTYYIISIVLYSLYLAWCLFALYLNCTFKPGDKAMNAQLRSKLIY